MSENQETHQDKIIKLKRQFLEEIASERDSYHDDDIERINLDDWNVERYLLHCKDDVNTALVMLRESMKWRKSYGVNDLKETDFPREYYTSGSFFSYAPDKKGNEMVYIRGKLHRKIAEWSELKKKFFVFKINQLDRRNGGRRYAAFWDCEGAGLCNVDMDVLSFMLSTVSQYFPYGLEYVLIVDLPLVLTTLYNLAKRWVPEYYQRLAIIINRDKVTDHIDRNNLPQYLGGVCKMDEKYPPPGVVSAQEIEKRNDMPPGSADKLETYLKQYCLSPNS
ncbi:motile sperm domain-containing protein 2-like [Brevipalpus obovatus]|uniref:motile sperm domain-containing protein 2-like n=1 Tax=Brevipalpus obovatus TaxID=246614 RepID=UPI003D9F2438